MSVPRFDLGPHQMTPSGEGRWVRYEDYATLEAENAALKAKLAKADGLARVLDEAREDLALWHEKWVQRQDGGLESVSCEGCSTCDILPEMDDALAAYKEDKR